MRQGRAVTGQGSNSALVGDFNARVVLSLLRRRGPQSKADLARRIGLTRNATGEIVRRLEEEGLVRATGKRSGGRGQPATVLDLHPEGASSIGVRIDRDRIDCLVVDLGGAILDRVVLEDLPPPREAVAAIAGHVRRFQRHLARAGRKPPMGIGVAMPFNLGSWLKELALPPGKYEVWDRFDLRSALAAATGLNVLVENDGSAAAVGELNQGSGREIDDYLYLFLGPAVGGGVVLEGDYLRGRRRNAGDIGVMPVRPSRLPSAPVSGRVFDPLLSRMSVNALTRHLAHHGIAAPSGRRLDAAIASHPALFEEWCADAIDAAVGPVLASVHLLDLPVVVFDGDLSPALLDRLAERLQDALNGATAESRDPPQVVRGRLGPDAAAIGAASLPLHKSFSPMRDALIRQPAGGMEAVA